MPAPVLSKTLDPVLGVFTGAFAFYLHQTNPRTAPPAGETFKDLASWKWTKWKASRSEKMQTGEGFELEEALGKLLKEDEHSHR